MRTFLNLTIPRKLLLAFLAMIAVVIAFTGVSVIQISNIQQASNWTAHTFNVIEAAESVRAAMIDQQTGLRGFLEGGRDEFLDPYRRGRVQAEDATRRLRQLTVDNPGQQRRIEALWQQIEDWHDKYAETRLATPVGQDPAADRALAAEGKAAMDMVRAQVGEIIAEERRLLDERMAGERVAIRTAYWAAGIGCLALLAVAGAAWWLLTRGIAQPIESMTRLMLRLAEDKLDVRVEGQGRRDELGGMARALAVFKDNAVERRRLQQEREAAARAVRENEARLRAIFDSVQEGILTADAAGAVESANGAVLRLFGHDAESLRAAGLPGLLALPGGEPLDAASVLARADGGSFEASGRRAGGGGLFPVEVTATRAGEDRLLTLTIRDISARKEMDRMKNEFISTVSHELRTPLTSIRGALGLVVGMGAGLPEKMLSLVQIAHRNAERLIGLVNDILDIEKIESGRMEFSFHHLDLAEAAAEAVEANNAYAAGRRVELRLKVETAPVMVMADAQRLQQVMANLISNAVKFSPEGGEVTVTVGVDPAGRARVAVHDVGPGVPESFRARIFQKFAQADSADSRAKGGTGLGLSISRMIVERHSGEVGFESRPGDTCFHIHLPLASDGRVVAADGPGAAPAPAQRRVLVCEDDAYVGQMLARMVEDLGVEVDLVHSAADARAALEARRYDGMTLDLGLPDEDGLSLFKSLRRDGRFRTLPVLVISAAATEGARMMNGDAVGIVDWLDKPVDEARLAEALRSQFPPEDDGRLPQILYVEDDRDLRVLVDRLLSGSARVVGAEDLAGARQWLAHQPFDLVILDIGLGEESGLDLLPFIATLDAPPPVLVFSAQRVSSSISGKVAGALLKSQTSNEDLSRRILGMIETRRGGAVA
ncbi:MAG TPA: CHASE3 domain-containing protein [Azospirillaceae bacterium]|nr:CHASE3 domain-containing protein [Azospirillaceae bacterium]